MKNNVKFIMNLEDCNCHVIEEAFKKAKGIFNWQLDEDFNAILINEDIDYRFIDVLDFKKDIGDLTDSFFKLFFDDSINVPLYKFIVLKDNDKFKILANISSLIFDYTSINDFYELFNDLNDNGYLVKDEYGLYELKDSHIFLFEMKYDVAIQEFMNRNGLAYEQLRLEDLELVKNNAYISPNIIYFENKMSQFLYIFSWIRDKVKENVNQKHRIIMNPAKKTSQKM